MMNESDTSLFFAEKSRSIHLKEENRLCEKGPYETYGFAKGNQRYSTGIHHVRIRLEKKNRLNNENYTSWSPWIFVGICSSDDRSAFGDVRYHKLRSSYGWSTNGDIWTNGQGKRHSWPSSTVENDVLRLTVDCDHRTLSLINERTNEPMAEIQVDLKDKTSFPWSLFVVLADQNYRVRLISSH